jgi:ATP-dependent helicase/nuclease subunit A
MTEALKIIQVPETAYFSPSALKARATDPANTVWVGASAGSGKTTFLTERLLRLLLPKNENPGADPAKIICITFTKAAASEVLERVMKYLRLWAIEPEEDLKISLKDILDTEPTQKQCDSARALFARVLEVPGGMKILTIHAFCQSILARFPMEAGLPAGFEVMEEGEAKNLLTSIRHRLITRLETDKGDKPLDTAFSYLASCKNIDDLEKLLTAMIAERGRIQSLLETYGTPNALCSAVYRQLEADESETDETLIAAFLKHIPQEKLKDSLPGLKADTSSWNKSHAEDLEKFLSLSAEEKIAQFRLYEDVFITGKGTPRPLYSVVKADEALTRLFMGESSRLVTLSKKRRDLATAASTTALLRFSLAILAEYEIEKARKNRLDFEDLIHKTIQLLGHGGVHWVQYKLDGGIDHILVDEAQDTNPDQWDIVNALSDEFYDGTSTREKQDRTTFVVGDEKQSIFSFQRADPRVFDTTKHRLEKRVKDAQLGFDDVPMQTSFRSAPSVLKLVDAVFKSPEMRSGVSRNDKEIVHIPHLSGKAGHVEIWPAIERTKNDARENWQLPILVEAEDNPVALLAARVAATIRDLLQNPAEKLESRGRRIEPGDIMILLAKRKPFADALLKALRRENIPVSGIDRMVVTKQLAVMDTLAAAAFVLQPEDDLNLATLLKSPLIGWNDEKLFGLCNNRTGSIWAVLQKIPAHEDIALWLKSLRDLAATENVSAFFHKVLYAPCPNNVHSGLQALMARLGVDITDPIQEFLRKADTHDMQDTRGLQGFYEDAQKDESEIKRQIHGNGGCIRLMTVHGSKGLEAPIVFLPDTIRSSQSAAKTDPILWPGRSEPSGLPLWASSSELRADALIERVSDAKLRTDEEYRRLLYVALTRAGERLYIGGAEYAKKGADRTNSWYDRVHAAFTNDTLTEVEAKTDGSLLIKNRQTDPVKNDELKPARNSNVLKRPEWLYTQAPTPEFPPRPLTPSKPDAPEPAALSPLFCDTSWRYARGRIIHALFQFLPALPPDNRDKKASEWLALPAHNLDEAAQKEILNAVMSVLRSSTFKDIFMPNSRAEIPLTGLLGKNRIVSGQIDRLVVMPDKILVLDYKTNRPAPKDKTNVPKAYLQQMGTYRSVLKEIWPDKAIHCALLWTDGPNLMDVTDILES